MSTPVYRTRVDNIDGLNESERRELKRVEEMYAFRANDYYLSLIDWDDPDDPIRRIILPDPRELEPWRVLDASAESTYTKTSGLQHKYEQTALLLVSDVCGGFCRYCFRKRLFMDSNRETVRDMDPDLAYIRDHPEITNILLTGGDPLILSTARLESIIHKLRQIEHVRVIRIGSKIPAFNPYRIINDPSLLALIRTYSTEQRRIYIMTQFTHQKELTDIAIDGIDLLIKAGAILANQTPLLRGINDDPGVLGDLLRSLSFIGVPPYYVFQCRPTRGNRHFVVPVEEGYGIFEQAKALCSGLAKRPRLIMSHQTGKIEVVGVDERHVYFKYHQAAKREDIGKFMVYRRNPQACWFDDYTEGLYESRVGSGIFPGRLPLPAQ